MSTNDHGPTSSPPPSPEAPSGTTPASPMVAAATGPSPTSRLVWVSALVGGLVAGLISWGGGEAVNNHFALQEEYQAVAARFPDMSPDQIRTEARANFELKEASLWYAIQGAVLGMILGLAGGLSRKSALRAILAGILGLVLGGGLAGGSAYKVVPHLKNALFESTRDDVATTIQTHLSGWLPAGLAGGLAFGFGLGGFRRIVGATLGGILGAAVGTVLNELVVTLAFPLVGTTRHLDTTWYTRLAACLIISLAVSLCTAVGAKERAAITTAPSS